ncbi:hypothetical protein M9458_057538, partial [Cirrhinus mrigala]
DTSEMTRSDMGVGSGKAPSQDSNPRHPERIGTVCQRAAHKAIGIDVFEEYNNIYAI